MVHGFKSQCLGFLLNWDMREWILNLSYKHLSGRSRDLGSSLAASVLKFDSVQLLTLFQESRTEVSHNVSQSPGNLTETDCD